MNNSVENSNPRETIPSYHEMLLAYRKVKAEIWWMKSIPSLKLLADYERNLETNLSSLRQLIADGFTDRVSGAFLGSILTLPKKLKPEESTSESAPPDKSEIHFTELSDRKASRKRKAAQWKTLEERQMAVPSIDFQILGVLWTMQDGGVWDAMRSPACRANVLRRQYVPGDASDIQENDSPPIGPINKNYPGVFKPYFHAYKSWRDDGLKKAEAALNNGQRVFALTLDLQRYYHQIDAGCLRKLHPVKEGDKLTEAFYKALEAWQKKYGEKPLENNGDEGEKLGIPVGLVASAVVANVILQPLDKAIEKQLSPIYYGRYVDDLFLVFQLNGDFHTGKAILKELEKLMARAAENEPRLAWNSDANTLMFQCESLWSKSVFASKAEKQRLFLLEGAPGKDLLKVIDSDLREHSSEWRMVPELDEKEDFWLKETLVASQDAAEGATTLRRSDGLSIRRLGVAIALRKLEAIERFGLKSSDWKKQRQTFYEVARTHIFTPEGLCDFWPKLPSLFGLIFANEDWGAANRFLTQLIEVKNSYYDLEERPEKGLLSNWLLEMVSDELMRSCSKPPETKEAFKFFKRFERDFGSQLAAGEKLEEYIQEFRKRDLDRQGFKGAARITQDWKERLEKASLVEAIDAAKSFLDDSEGSIPPEPLRWIVFPTRPLGEIELSLRYPKAVLSASEMRRCLNAVRGQELQNLPATLKDLVDKGSSDQNSAPGTDKQDDRFKRPPPKRYAFKTETNASAVKVAIANFATKEESWTDRVREAPDLSRLRLLRLLTLTDDFLRAIKQHSWCEKPLYFIMPELSIPGEWITEIAGYFTKAGVSLIAGGEYEKEGDKSEVINPAYLFLRHKNLGYPSTCVVRQKKTKPAPAEALGLWKEREISLTGQDVQDLAVYEHGNFHFGVLICSELTDAEVQHHFRGHVDALLCLEWNPDIDTFEALVRAATQTVHCFVVQVNNRKYGDSRIRAPGKKSYQRDLARIHGGIHDSFVVGELPIEKLRNFQKKYHSDLNEEAPYKPLPSGYTPLAYPRLNKVSDQTATDSES